MNPENIVAGQRSQTQKGQILHDSIYAKRPGQAKPQRHKADQEFPGAGQQRQWAVTTYRYGASFGGDKYVGELVLMVAQPGEYTKKTTVDFEGVNFILCELYLNKNNSYYLNYCWG